MKDMAIEQMNEKLWRSAIGHREPTTKIEMLEDIRSHQKYILKDSKLLRKELQELKFKDKQCLLPSICMRQLEVLRMTEKLIKILEKATK